MLPSFAVCHRFDAHGEGDTVETLAEATQIPVTQAATAMAFLLERGIITAECRRNYPATIDVHLDGMTEYHALPKGAPVPAPNLSDASHHAPPSPAPRRGCSWTRGRLAHTTVASRTTRHANERYPSPAAGRAATIA